MSTLGGCARNGALNFQGLPTVQKAEGDEYSIRFVSAKIIDLIDPLPDPVHNSLRFVNTKTGNEIGRIDGVALDRKTGTVANIGGGNDYLFVSKNYKDLDDADTMVTEIFSGNYKDVMRYYLVAMDATRFINQQNLRYQLMGFFENGQNSNSVARTVTEEALGFKVPKRHHIFITPGHHRSLLPEKWTSFYVDCPLPSDPAILKSYVEKIEALAYIKNYAIPPSIDRPFYFMPDMPFVKYQPLIIPEILTQSGAIPNQSLTQSVITAAPQNLLAEPAP